MQRCLTALNDDINTVSLSLSCRMWVTLLYSCAAGAALLYTLYRWVIPTLVQYHGGLALFWHDFIVERMLDTLTQSTRPQVCFYCNDFTADMSNSYTATIRFV